MESYDQRYKVHYPITWKSARTHTETHTTLLNKPRSFLLSISTQPFFWTALFSLPAQWRTLYSTGKVMMGWWWGCPSTSKAADDRDVWWRLADNNPQDQVSRLPKCPINNQDLVCFFAIVEGGKIQYAMRHQQCSPYKVISTVCQLLKQQAFAHLCAASCASQTSKTCRDPVLPATTSGRAKVYKVES